MPTLRNQAVLMDRGKHTLVVDDCAGHGSKDKWNETIAIGNSGRFEGRFLIWVIWLEIVSEIIG